jgi:citrate synthase
VSDEFKPGLEGVIAFESEIAEPDKEGSALRYRGVDIEDLVGRISFGNVWGLLVDDEFNASAHWRRSRRSPISHCDVGSFLGTKTIA